MSTGSRLSASSPDSQGVLTTDAAKARYILTAESKFIDTCIPSGVAYAYDVTISDTKTNAEVMSMNGSGCEGQIIPKIRQSLP